jgi:hypothetical protein
MLFLDILGGKFLNLLSHKPFGPNSCLTAGLGEGPTYFTLTEPPMLLFRVNLQGDAFHLAS